jgi:hypothetical protein
MNAVYQNKFVFAARGTRSVSAVSYHERVASSGANANRRWKSEDYSANQE